MNKPNVLLILSDQQRYDTINWAGFNHMITPNLDMLAQESTMYCNAHSSNPVCMPARHDLITGFPARVHGYFANGEKQSIKDYSTPTIARIFSEHNYRTVAVGKMHFFPTREHHGFNEMFLMEELPKNRQNDQYAMYLKEQGLEEIQNLHGVRPLIYHIPQKSQQDEAHHGTTWVADRSIEWIKENEGNPFFMMCGFIQPHPPWNIPEEFDGIYDNKNIPDPIPVSRLPFEEKERGEWFGDNDTKDQKEKIRKAYFTSISMVDKSVGRIIDYLRETGQLDNTLIIYTSDHGEMLQDKGYYSKELPYDSAVRVPMIIKYPYSYRKGECTDEFADLLDLLPTCLDVCDIEYPRKDMELYGTSLRTNTDREYQYSATGNLPIRWVMCRNKRYKYVYHFIGGYEELFDMQKNEVKNLLEGSRSIEECEIYLKLKEKAIEYEEKWGVEDSVTNGDFLKLPLEKLHPSVRSKYHFWSNHQMQVFYEAQKHNRGEILKKEIINALSNFDRSGLRFPDIFLEEEWRKDFENEYEVYTDQKTPEDFFDR